MGERTPVISVKNLTVTLHKKRSGARKVSSSQVLVDNVSFEVYPGECLGILGESGSGKSLTIKSITGLLDDSFHIEGQALFGGEDLLKQSKEQLRSIRGSSISMVLQNPMSCFDPLCRIGLHMSETFEAHTSWSKQQIHDESVKVLKRMLIHEPEEVLKKYPHQVSGGMLQRIMIGLALALRPRLLVADEPTTAIDAITQFEILYEFQEITKSNESALIFITHDLGALAYVADRALVLNKGKLVDQGSIHDIIAHARDPYTRLLVEKKLAVMKRYHEVLRKGGSGAGSQQR